MRRRDFVGAAIAGAAAVVVPATLLFAQAAQAEQRFKARLGWVPISGAERDRVAGRGEAVATFFGSRLSVTGSFEGLPAAASAARLHQGVATGASGPAIAELTVTRAENGTFEGDVELTPEQLAALRAGYVYVQLHAAGKGLPEDNSVLWGWLFPEDDQS